MSRTITLSGTSSILTANFVQPIVLDGQEWGIGLVDFHTYNNIANVTEKNNEIKIGQHEIKIPTGAYEIEEINEAINSELKRLRDDDLETFRLRGNLNTMQCEMESAIHDVDLSSMKSIAPLIGFERKCYVPEVKHFSTLPVDIMDVDDIRIECSIAAGSFHNDRHTNIVYAFYPDVPPGYKLVQRPSTIIYLPLTTNSISEIRIRILDQNDKLIDFRGERVTVRLHIHKQ